MDILNGDLHGSYWIFLLDLEGGWHSLSGPCIQINNVWHTPSDLHKLFN